MWMFLLASPEITLFSIRLRCCGLVGLFFSFNFQSLIRFKSLFLSNEFFLGIKITYLIASGFVPFIKRDEFMLD